MNSSKHRYASHKTRGVEQHPTFVRVLGPPCIHSKATVSLVLPIPLSPPIAAATHQPRRLRRRLSQVSMWLPPPQVASLLAAIAVVFVQLMRNLISFALVDAVRP
jgi:hypothetical protein